MGIFPCLRFLAPISPAWPRLPRSNRPSHLGEALLAFISLHHVVSWLLTLPTEFKICEWHKHEELPSVHCLSTALSLAHDGTTNSSSNSHQNYLGYTSGERIWLTKSQKISKVYSWEHVPAPQKESHHYIAGLQHVKTQGCRILSFHGPVLRPWNRCLDPWRPTCFTKAPSMLHTNSCSCPHLWSREWLTSCDIFTYSSVRMRTSSLSKPLKALVDIKIWWVMRQCNNKRPRLHQTCQHSISWLGKNGTSVHWCMVIQCFSDLCKQSCVGVVLQSDPRGFPAQLLCKHRKRKLLDWY